MALSAHKNRYRVGEHEEASLDDWLVTYADMITLLMSFFIVVIGATHVDKSRFEQINAAIQSEIAGNVTIKTPLTKIKSDLDSMLRQEQKDKRVHIERKAEGIELEFASSSFYEPGTATIGASSMEMINKVTTALKNIDYYPFAVDIEGHTDDVPIHTVAYPSNWELSVNRATNIVKSMVESGIKPERLKAAGYADTKPKAPNLDSLGNPIPENRAMNRRVVVRIH